MDKLLIKYVKILFVIMPLTIQCVLMAQEQSDKGERVREKYLFYLHGKIIEDQGIHAVHTMYGPYEYEKILEVFSSKGFNVISEVRPPETHGFQYAEYVATQIQTLLKKGISPEDITVVGASKGGSIAVILSSILKNPDIRFVIMSVCNSKMNEVWKENHVQLWGKVLYMYDVEDKLAGSMKPCLTTLESPGLSSFKEIMLTVGTGHGVLYSPHEQWITPVLEW